MNRIFRGIKVLVAIVAMSTLSASAAYAGNPPVVTTFGAFHLVGNSWWLHGTVDDPTPANILLQFSGVVQAAITIDADGSFSYVATVNSTGIVNAVAYSAIEGESAVKSDYIFLD